MKVNLFSNRIKSAVIFIICLCAIIITLIFSLYNSAPSPASLACKSDMSIIEEDLNFYGVFDLKSNENKGIINLNGILYVKPDKQYTVQRTVLFTRSNFGISPIFTSIQVIASNKETAPEEKLSQILPKFYIKPHEVTDVDIFKLDKYSFLITKSDIPYLYCTTKKV